MASFTASWQIQSRVIEALMIRELTTRYGRENIGFLWVMLEPLLFGSLVAVLWTYLRGSEDHGMTMAAFVITGYLPLTLFRNAVSRSVSVFEVNASLLYHRHVKLIDFVFVRFLIEAIGGMMAYLFAAAVLNYFGLFPIPSDLAIFLTGWILYSYFVLATCAVVAPLSSMSSTLEKVIPVTTYIMIPLSGAFNMASWVTPEARSYLLWSPPVNAMEMMRAGVFGGLVSPFYGFAVPIIVPTVMLIIGLFLCRRVRRTLVVE